MKYFLLFFILCCSSMTYGQSRFRGRVTSAKDSLPLAGATIKIQNSVQSTLSDQDGNFELSVIAPKILLEVTYIGYQTRIISVELPQTGPLTISLQAKTGELKEVVVSTGYQVLPKERATGSFTQVDNQLFNQQVSTTTLGRLETIASGVTIDRSTSKAGRILIRGLSTINGPSQPLIVLDNFPYEGDPNNINPNNVLGILRQRLRFEDLR